MRSLGLPTGAGAWMDQRELITEKPSSISENLRILAKNHKQPGGSPTIVSLTQQIVYFLENHDGVRKYLGLISFLNLLRSF